MAYLEDLLGDYTVKPQGNAAMLLQWVEQGALVRSLYSSIQLPGQSRWEWLAALVSPL